MSTQRTFTVGFTRLDGQFRHAEVKQGTKLKALLLKFGYSESELAAAARDVRVNGNEVQGLEYELQADDTVAVVPNVKGGR
jgi:molybdopterin converting factor small subunit